MKYIFEKDYDKFTEDFMNVYSPICRTFYKFKKADGKIVNEYNEETKEFEYISMVSKAVYGTGTKIKTECDFVKYGAPLIVLSDDICKEGEILRYGRHFEIVAYENGLNVWKIDPFPERTERPIKPEKIGFMRFEIEAKSKISLEVTVNKGQFQIEINGKSYTVNDEDIPTEFHGGITACEGVNGFYNFEIE